MRSLHSSPLLPRNASPDGGERIREVAGVEIGVRSFDYARTGFTQDGGEPVGEILEVDLLQAAEHRQADENESRRGRLCRDHQGDRDQQEGEQEEQGSHGVYHIDLECLPRKTC